MFHVPIPHGNCHHFLRLPTLSFFLSTLSMCILCFISLFQAEMKLIFPILKALKAHCRPVCPSECPELTTGVCNEP